MPPWTTPTQYCDAVSSWGVRVITLQPFDPKYGSVQLCLGAPQTPVTALGTCTSLLAQYTRLTPIWGSDSVFCLSWVGGLWGVMLTTALLFWVFFATLAVLHTFQWRDLAGFSLPEVLKALGSQVGLLIVMVGSFALVLLAHQLVYLLSNTFVANSLAPWRLDSLWSTLADLTRASANQANNLDPNSGASSFFGGNLPDSSGPFGLTWGQVFGGLESFEVFVLAAIVPVRFAVELLAVISAPLALMAAGHAWTRRIFTIWLEFWLEVEGLALISALILGVYLTLKDRTDFASLLPEERAYILLGLLGLVGGANLAFLWKICGQFLSNITAYYQQQYQRQRQTVGVLAQLGLGAVGLAATVLTDGAALPYVLGAEGLLNAGLNLGAPPGGAVPGFGVGRALIGAGQAQVGSARQQAAIEMQQQNLALNQARTQAYLARQGGGQAGRGPSGGNGGGGTPGPGPGGGGGPGRGPGASPGWGAGTGRSAGGGAGPAALSATTPGSPGAAPWTPARGPTPGAPSPLSAGRGSSTPPPSGTAAGRRTPAPAGPAGTVVARAAPAGAQRQSAAPAWSATPDAQALRTSAGLPNGNAPGLVGALAELRRRQGEAGYQHALPFLHHYADSSRALNGAEDDRLHAVVAYIRSLAWQAGGDYTDQE